MIKSKWQTDIDQRWESFRPVNQIRPKIIIDLIAYLLFIRRLDVLQMRKEEEARRLGQPIIDPIYTSGQEELRWHSFAFMDPEVRHRLFVQEDGVLNFLQSFGQGAHPYSKFFKTPLLVVPSSSFLQNAIEIIHIFDTVDDQNRSDCYDYLVNKMSVSDLDGGVPTPPHLIRLLVELVQPKAGEVVMDLFAGSGSILSASACYAARHATSERASGSWERTLPATGRFIAVEPNSVIGRIAAAHLVLQGMDNFDLKTAGAFDLDHASFSDVADLVISNLSMVGNYSHEVLPINQNRLDDRSETGLIYLNHVLKGLKQGGRAAVLVPETLLTGNSPALIQMRQELVERNRLEAVISLPESFFKAYTGVGTDLLIFKKIASSNTDKVWFHKMKNDGMNKDNAGENEIPEVLRQWENRNSENGFVSSESSFLVPTTELKQHGYSLNAPKYTSRTKGEEPLEPLQAPPAGDNGSAPESVDEVKRFRSIRKKNAARYARARWRRRKKSILDARLLFLLIPLGALGSWFLLNTYYSDENSYPIASHVPPPVEKSRNDNTEPSLNDPSSKNPEEVHLGKEEANQAYAKDNKEGANDVTTYVASLSLPVPSDREDHTPDIHSAKAAMMSNKHLNPDKPMVMRYKVLSSSYLYEQPDENSQRTSPLITWDDSYFPFQALEERNGFVHAVVSRRSGEAFTGWIPRKDLGQISVAVEVDDEK